MAERDANRLGAALLPLRLFLGLTFVYGGIQKLSDPGYLHPGAPTYIGTQLHGFANGTPGGFVLRIFAIPHAEIAGIGVALAEIAIGLLVAAGVFTRPAAAAGLGLNLLLFLTNSWRTYPYFLGSDIVFVFAWLPFVLIGASRQLTLEALLHRLATRRLSARRAGQRRAGAYYRPESAPRLEHDAVTRRTLIGTAVPVLGGVTAFIAGMSALTKGSYRAPPSLGASTRPTRSPSTTPATTTEHAPVARRIPARQSSPLPPGAVRLGPASRLPPGQGATYSDPRDGSPNLVIRQPNGRLVAHSAVCTHAGCTVGYQGGQIVCPCHGATFNARTGAVEGGPAPQGLPPRRVLEHGGDIYAVPA